MRAAGSSTPFAQTPDVVDLLPAGERPTRSERQESTQKSAAIPRESSAHRRKKRIRCWGKQRVTSLMQPTSLPTLATSAGGPTSPGK